LNRWKDWYDQGKRDYERALIDVQYGYYEWACFTLQQSAEKVIKAMGLARGLTLWGHSLTEMLKLIGQETGIEVPAAILDRARLLDLYYIPPRYPNGFASGKPADYFTEAQAREALDAADQIIRFCEGHLPGSG
jgi:HEPN domain-containing protein